MESTQLDKQVGLAVSIISTNHIDYSNQQFVPASSSRRLLVSNKSADAECAGKGEIERGVSYPIQISRQRKRPKRSDKQMRIEY